MDAKFELGRVVITKGAAERLEDAAIKDNDRILAVYKYENTTIWIITECDRSVTTILFPSEY